MNPLPAIYDQPLNHILMENEENNVQPEQQPPSGSIPSDSMHIDAQMRDFLLESARWMKFIAIIGFIACGLILLGGLFMMMVGSSRSMRRSGLMLMRGPSPAAIGFGYIIGAVIGFFPFNHMFRAALGIANGLIMGDHSALMDGMANMKSYFRFRGIATIIGLSLYALMLLFMIMAGLSRM